MNWSAKIVQHKKEPRIAVYFEYNPQLAERINEFEGAKWSQTLKAWHVPDTEENRIRFKFISHLYTLPSATRNASRILQTIQAKNLFV